MRFGVNIYRNFCNLDGMIHWESWDYCSLWIKYQIRFTLAFQPSNFDQIEHGRKSINKYSHIQCQCWSEAQQKQKTGRNLLFYQLVWRVEIEEQQQLEPQINVMSRIFGVEIIVRSLEWIWSQNRCLNKTRATCVSRECWLQNRATEQQNNIIVWILLLFCTHKIYYNHLNRMGRRGSAVSSEKDSKKIFSSYCTGNASCKDRVRAFRCSSSPCYLNMYSHLTFTATSISVLLLYDSTFYLFIFFFTFFFSLILSLRLATFSYSISHFAI